MVETSLCDALNRGRVSASTHTPTDTHRSRGMNILSAAFYKGKEDEEEEKRDRLENNNKNAINKRKMKTDF